MPSGLYDFITNPNFTFVGSLVALDMKEFEKKFEFSLNNMNVTNLALMVKH